jgi:HD superfamily phosphohydrolase
MTCQGCLVSPREGKEIRDPIFAFVRADSAEMKVVDSPAFQRLRGIHQLAMTYLVYPGASHKRFEHSLGVMEVAGKIFDVVTRQDKLSDRARELLPRPVELAYWRNVLRIAALCHDMGHFPFSHASEVILPPGVSHETMSRRLIFSDPLVAVFDSMRPAPKAEDVCKLALGPGDAPDLRFTPWEEILAEMIVGDVFGADRIDYLLRDSLHVGVAYGRFDYFRLIDTLRILPEPGDVDDPAQFLGIERGGLESAEALLYARYFMFSQVYSNPIRMVYDQHLKDFLLDWLPGGHYPEDPVDHLRYTDDEIVAALHTAARSRRNRGYKHACCIVKRRHFKVLYERLPSDVALYPEAASAIFEAAVERFGEENVKYADSRRPGRAPDFPVLQRDGTTASSLQLSDALNHLPEPKNEFVFIEPVQLEEANRWLRANKRDIIDSAREREQE